MAEAQIVARAKVQQNYCQKIKLPRKSRGLAWKNNELLKLRPVYTTANFGYGTDKNSTGTKK